VPEEQADTMFSRGLAALDEPAMLLRDIEAIDVA
jgi:hypothetical protein